MSSEIDIPMPTEPAPAEVHPTAVVDPDAMLAHGVTVGPYSIIEANVRVGGGTQIDSHVRIGRGTTIGRDNRIAHGAVLGTPPQDVKYANEPTELLVGDRNIIREYATLHRGTTNRGKTEVGSDGFFMTYSHVGHDCVVGDHVVLANSVHLGGHVVIEDWVVIGGVVPVHQFARIGCHSIVGGGFRVAQDICPYALAGGYPLRVVAPNVVGLKRRGFSSDQIRPIKHAFRLLFKSNYNTTQAIAVIEREVEQTTEIARLLDFIRNSTRGLTK